MKLRHLLPALLFAALPLTAAHAFVDVSITVAPPVLPVYEQPPCPVEGYLWTPGYYGYGDAGYYWVPGIWCAPPRVGFLWTPGYWGFDEGFYAFHTGYWGPTVGFYGGVNYGYGYGGYGYYGGRWDGAVFRYNTAVTRVNTTIIHNTYVNRTVIREGVRPGGASFNGRGGISARPDARQLAAARGPRLQPTGDQVAKQGPAVRNGIGERGASGLTAQRPRDGAGRLLSPQDQDRANRLSQNVANERPVTQRVGRDGLSPEERQVVNRRQAALDQRRATPDRGYGFDRGAQGPGGGYGERSARYPNGNNNGLADSRSRSEKQERQQQKQERRAEGGQDRKRDDRKRDKHGDDAR